MTEQGGAFRDPPSGRDPNRMDRIDRMLAFVDGELSALDSDRLLAKLSAAERERLKAMRADAIALRAVRAPDAPEELHELVLASAERAELFAVEGAASGRRTVAVRRAASSGGVLARPWAVRWRAPVGVAAMLAVAVGVGWAVWPSRTPHRPAAVVGSNAIAPASYAPVPAPFALVLEFDDFDDADAALRSAVQDSPEAKVLCVCEGHCTTLVEGPPHVVGDEGASAELMATADCPTHKVAIPATELSRVLGALVGSGKGTIEARRFGAERWSAPSAGTVELPVFILPSR